MVYIYSRTTKALAAAESEAVCGGGSGGCSGSGGGGSRWSSKDEFFTGIKAAVSVLTLLVGLQLAKKIVDLMSSGPSLTDQAGRQALPK